MKYFINVEGNGPVGYLALGGNGVLNREREEFLTSYITKVI